MQAEEQKIPSRSHDRPMRSHFEIDAKDYIQAVKTPGFRVRRLALIVFEELFPVQICLFKEKGRTWATASGATISDMKQHLTRQPFCLFLKENEKGEHFQVCNEEGSVVMRVRNDGDGVFNAIIESAVKQRIRLVLKNQDFISEESDSDVLDSVALRAVIAHKLSVNERKYASLIQEEIQYIKSESKNNMERESYLRMTKRNYESDDIELIKTIKVEEASEKQDDFAEKQQTIRNRDLEKNPAQEDDAHIAANTYRDTPTPSTDKNGNVERVTPSTDSIGNVGRGMERRRKWLSRCVLGMVILLLAITIPMVLNSFSDTNHCDSEGIRIECPFDRLLGNISLNKDKFKFKEKIYILEDSSDSWVANCLKSVQSSQDEVFELFTKIQPFLIDLIERKAGMKTALRKFKEKTDTEKLDRFLESFGPKDAIIAVIESVDEFYSPTLGEKIYSAGYPIPLGYFKNSSYTFNYKLLEETFYKNDIPLFAWVTTSNYERNSKVLYGKEIFGLQSTTVVDYLEAKSYKNQFSIDLYRRSAHLSNHWLNLAEIHGITKNLEHQSALQTVLNFSAVVLVHIGPEDSISDKTSEINQLFALLKQQIVPDRGYIIALVHERAAINNLAEFKAKLEEDFGSRFLDLIQYKSFTNAEVKHKSQHQRAISNLSKLFLEDDPTKYIMHSITYFRDFYLAQIMGKNWTQDSGSSFNTIHDEKYNFYLKLLNEFEPLILKASNFETDFEDTMLRSSNSNDTGALLFPRLFPFSHNVAEINKLEQEREYLNKKSAFASYDEMPQIYAQYQTAERKKEFLKNQSQLIKLNPVVRVFIEAFLNPSIFSSPANWAIWSWVEPHQHKRINHIASLKGSSETEKKIFEKLVIELVDTDITLETFMNELLYSPIEKEVEDSIRNYLNTSIFQHNPLNLINERLEFGNQLLPQIFKNIPIHYKIYVISILGPQSSGKSTLLNYLFGLGFKTSAGRCTKGIYFTLLLNPELGVAFLLLDTEGLMALKRSGSKFDNQMATFIFSVSNLVIINYKGEIQENTLKLIEVCAYALKVLSMKKNKPTIFWALQSMVAQENTPETLQAIQQNMIRDLKERVEAKNYFKLDELFDLKPENVFPFPPPFHHKEDSKILEYNGAYGSRILEFREKIIKSCLNDPIPYQSGAYLYEHFQQNWRTVIEFADDLMQAKSLLERKLISEAYAIGASIFDSLKSQFIAHFDPLLDSFEDSSFMRPDKFYDDLDQQVYFLRGSGDTLITNNIKNQPKFQPLLEEVPMIRQRLIQDLNNLKSTYRAKHEVKYNYWIKKQQCEDAARIYSSLANNFDQKNYTLTIEELNKSMNENITRVTQQAEYQLGMLISNIYKFFEDFVKLNLTSTKDNWQIPMPTQIKERIEKGPGDISLEYIAARWYQQNVLQSVAATVAVLIGYRNPAIDIRDHYFNFIGKYESICENKPFSPQKEVQTILTQIPHHLSHVSLWKGMNYFILTEEYKFTLLLEFQVLIYNCMASQIVFERDRSIQEYRGIFQKQIQDLKNLATESDSSRVFADKIIKDIFTDAVIQLATDLTENLAAQLEDKLKEKFPTPQKLNEEAYARSFKKPKEKQEDFVPVVKYILNLKKFIGEIYDDEVQQLFEQHFKTYVSKQLEIDFQNLAKRLKSLLVSLQTGDILSSEPYFYWIREFQTNTSSLYNFVMGVRQEEEPKNKGLYIHFIDTLQNQIQNCPRPVRFKESQQIMVKILRNLLDSFESKKSELEPFFSKLQNYTEGFEGMENMTSNYIYWLFRTDPFLGKYKPPVISVKIQSIESFLAKALETVDKEMEGLSEKIQTVNNTLNSSIFQILKAKQPALVGCMEQCPICGEKCSLPNDGHHDHHAHTHNLGGFRSFYNTQSGKILLDTCSSEEIRKLTWDYDGKDVNFTEFVHMTSRGAWSKNFPKGDKSRLKTEDQILSWVGTKDFFLDVYRVEDSTNPEWEKKVNLSIRLPKNVTIPGYTDQEAFLVMRNLSNPNLTKEALADPFHFVLILDSSESMTGGPWNDLLASVRRFLAIREKKRGPKETVSIIVFSTASQVAIKNASVSVTLADNITFIGAGTFYGRALEDLEALISAEPEDSKTKFIPIFMSDGIPLDRKIVTPKIKEFAKNHKKKCQTFWTIGFGSSDFHVLKEMAQEMGGEYKSVLNGTELGEVYEKIARTFYFVRH